MATIAVDKFPLESRLTRYFRDQVDSCLVGIPKRDEDYAQDVVATLAGRVEGMLGLTRQFAHIIRTGSQLIEQAIQLGLLTWDNDSDAEMQQWFASWNQSCKDVRLIVQLRFVLNGVSKETLEQFHKDDAFVLAWITDQSAYEAGEDTTGLPLPKESWPDASWYQETFERSVPN